MTRPAVSLHQPYASGVISGAKWIETRSWCPPLALIGRRLVIHATAKRPAPVYHHVDEPAGLFEHFATTGEVESVENPDQDGQCVTEWVGPVGVVLGTVEVLGAVPMVEDAGGVAVPGFIGMDVDEQRPWGVFEPDRWAWILSEPTPVDEECPGCDGACVECPACDGDGFCSDPIPAKGRQRIWRWSPGQ